MRLNIMDVLTQHKYSKSQKLTQLTIKNLEFFISVAQGREFVCASDSASNSTGRITVKPLHIKEAAHQRGD